MSLSNETWALRNAIATRANAAAADAEKRAAYDPAPRRSGVPRLSAESDRAMVMRWLWRNDPNGEYRADMTDAEAWDTLAETLDNL